MNIFLLSVGVSGFDFPLFPDLRIYEISGF